MIDKQKLLQWIEGKKYVFAVDEKNKYSIDYDTLTSYGCLKILNMIERDIELGELDEVEGNEHPELLEAK